MKAKFINEFHQTNNPLGSLDLGQGPRAWIPFIDECLNSLDIDFFKQDYNEYEGNLKTNKVIWDITDDDLNKRTQIYLYGDGPELHVSFVLYISYSDRTIANDPLDILKKICFIKIEAIKNHLIHHKGKLEYYEELNKKADNFEKTLKKYENS